MRAAQKVRSEAEMDGSFGRGGKPSADEVSRCVLHQRVDSTVLRERLLDQPAQPASRDD